MRKIPTVYLRDPENPRHVTDEPHPDCEWVLKGEGVATRKYDGTCTMLDNVGEWWARREVKPGKEPPADWMPVDEDPTTGKRVGWQPIADSPFSRFHFEALAALDADEGWSPGTYELCGPRINLNPERFTVHRLIPHGQQTFNASGHPPPAAYVDRCRALSWEGIVWHHPDGRRAKLKVRDYPEPTT